MSVLIGFGMFLLVLSIGIAVGIGCLAWAQWMLNMLHLMREKRIHRMRRLRVQRAAAKSA